MITEKTLKRYRRDALESIKAIHSEPKEGLSGALLLTLEINNRILKLTQELLDQHLVRKG